MDPGLERRVGCGGARDCRALKCGQDPADGREERSASRLLARRLRSGPLPGALPPNTPCCNAMQPSTPTLHSAQLFSIQVTGPHRRVRKQGYGWFAKATTWGVRRLACAYIWAACCNAHRAVCESDCLPAATAIAVFMCLRYCRVILYSGARGRLESVCKRDNSTRCLCLCSAAQPLAAAACAVPALPACSAARQAAQGAACSCAATQKPAAWGGGAARPNSIQ